MMHFLSSLNQLLWAIPVTGLLMGLHLFYTFYLLFPQRHILSALCLPFIRKEKTNHALSPLRTLSTILAATLGTGNIIGVSTAIALGGPGALFWCLLTGILGMATAYAESYLCVSYRITDVSGEFHGGPMYILSDILGKKKMAVLFALLTIPVSFCIGSATQAGALASVVTKASALPPTLIALIVSLLAGIILLGGIRSISGVCSILVPFMSIIYIGCCLFLLVKNAAYILPATKLMLQSAFTTKCIAGSILPSSFLLAMRFGIARGLFTNEAGLGTTPIAASSGEESNPVKAGLLSMSAVFWDTPIFCTLTGMTILTALVKNPAGFQNCDIESLTSRAFSELPLIGEELLGTLILLFAFTTLIGWSYYGEQASYFLWGQKSIRIYRYFYIAFIFIGILFPLTLIFELTDLFNACMIFPNCYLLCKMFRYVKRR